MSTPPRENLYRASYPGVELRAGEDGKPPTLTGHFAVFDQWTEIASSWEGNFMERLSPGSFKKTFTENRDGMRVLLNHGKDPQLGNKPIASIETLREDATGAYYEAPLLDGLDPLVMSGLRAGAYGASFRFKVMREDPMNEDPGVSTSNPKGLPERTIREAQVMEFGPVTFPAYAGATAGVRSITDLIHDVDAVALATPILLDDERLAHARAFITRSIPEAVEETRGDEPTDSTDTLTTEDAPPVGDAEPAKAHLSRGRRGNQATDKWWRPGDQREVPTSWRSP
jgi:HK97 family phage prohead protease